MAVFFAIGGAVLGFGALAAAAHTDHSAHSAYSRYGDADARRAKRQACENKIRDDVKDLENKKRQDLNPKLTSQDLIRESAMRVDDSAMDKNAKKAIRNKEAQERTKELSSLQTEINEINDILQKIDAIQDRR